MIGSSLPFCQLYQETGKVGLVTRPTSCSLRGSSPTWRTTGRQSISLSMSRRAAEAAGSSGTAVTILLSGVITMATGSWCRSEPGGDGGLQQVFPGNHPVEQPFRPFHHEYRSHIFQEHGDGGVIGTFVAADHNGGRF